jgi:hypothetical protein
VCKALSTNEDSMMDAGHVQQCLYVENNGKRLMHNNALPHTVKIMKTKMLNMHLKSTGASGVV